MLISQQEFLIVVRSTDGGDTQDKVGPFFFFFFGMIICGIHFSTNFPVRFRRPPAWPYAIPKLSRSELMSRDLVLSVPRPQNCCTYILCPQFTDLQRLQFYLTLPSCLQQPCHSTREPCVKWNLKNLHQKSCPSFLKILRNDQFGVTGTAWVIIFGFAAQFKEEKNRYLAHTVSLQWFSIFLMRGPFKTVPHGVVAPNHKIIHIIATS